MSEKPIFRNFVFKNSAAAGDFLISAAKNFPGVQYDKKHRGQGISPARYCFFGKEKIYGKEKPKNDGWKNKTKWAHPHD